MIRRVSLARTSFGFLSIGVLALFACSSTSGGSSASGSCADYVAALRDGAKQCGKTNAPPADREAELTARAEKQCANQLAAPGNGITAAILADCSQKVRAACGDDDACDDIEVKGTLPDGAACSVDTQCAGGDCKNATTSNSRCGTCAPRVPIGGACGGTNPSCVKGATCETKAGETGTCVVRTRAAEGEICYDPTKPSSVSISCAEGLACKIQTGSTTSTTPVKCTRRGGAGTACTSESDCLDVLACVNGACGNPGPEGTPCTTSGQCATGACSQTTKKCVPIQWIAGGGDCDGSERRCTRGSCAISSGGTPAVGKCIDPLPDGAACKVDAPSTEPQCDRYASCIAGTCQFFDPATCK